MILLIDNFDPYMREFYKYIVEEYSDITVARNDEMIAEDVIALNPKAVIIGSGIGCTADTGVCCDVIKLLPDKTPVLGIGLGAEVLAGCLGASFENNIINIGLPYNVGFDKSSEIFRTLPDIITFYTSVSRTLNGTSCPENICITAQDEYGRYIAFEDKNKNAFGLCTYPVFFGDSGKNIIRNFISIIGE